MATAVEAAVQLGVSLDTVYRFTHQGLLKAERTDEDRRTLNIDDNSLAALLAEPGTERTITVKQTAQSLGVCTETIRRFIKAGLLPAYRYSKPRGWLHIPVSAVEEFKNSSIALAAAATDEAAQ